MVSKVTEECDEKMKNIPSYEANGHVRQSEQQSSGPSKSASNTSQSHFEHPMRLDEVSIPESVDGTFRARFRSLAPGELSAVCLLRLYHGCSSGVERTRLLTSYVTTTVEWIPCLCGRLWRCVLKPCAELAFV